VKPSNHPNPQEEELQVWQAAAEKIGLNGEAKVTTIENSQRVGEKIFKQKTPASDFNVKSLLLLLNDSSSGIGGIRGETLLENVRKRVSFIKELSPYLFPLWYAYKMKTLTYRELREIGIPESSAYRILNKLTDMGLIFNAGTYKPRRSKADITIYITPNAMEEDLEDYKRSLDEDKEELREAQRLITGFFTSVLEPRGLRMVRQYEVGRYVRENTVEFTMSLLEEVLRGLHFAGVRVIR